MRRVVVTGMGIVSSIGNNTQEVLGSLREAKPGIIFADSYAELGFQLPGPWRAACRIRRRTSTGAPPASWAGGAAWNYIAMEQAIQDAGLEQGRGVERTDRHHHGFGRPIDPRHRRGGRHHPQQGRPAAHRAVRRSEGDEFDEFGDARHALRDQGRELFDLLGLRHVEPLHRQCDGA